MLSTILIFCSIQISLTQNIDETIALADSIKKIGQFELAQKLYSRVLFFDKSTNKANIYLSLADCYHAQTKYKNAEKYYTYASFSAQDSLLFAIQFKKSVSQIKQKKYKYALQTIYSLPDSLCEQSDKTRALHLATIYFALEDFNKAYQYFLSLVPDTALAARKQINQIFLQKKHLYNPNPNVVYYFSTIIPGSGQLIYGDIKNSLNSLLLTGGLGLLTIYTSINYSVIDAFLSVFPWFFRYYQGGATNAEKKAIDKRKEKRAYAYNQLLKLVKPYF